MTALLKVIIVVDSSISARAAGAIATMNPSFGAGGLSFNSDSRKE